MVPVTVFPLCVGAACLGSAGALALLADVQTAMRKAGISHKSVAIDINARVPRLSEQLNGQLPFTFWCRFADLADDFWRAFIEVRAPRFGLRVVDRDLADLVDAVGRLEKHMAKMQLPEREQERESA